MKASDFVIKEIQKNDGSKVFYVGKMTPKRPQTLSQFIGLKPIEFEFNTVGSNGYICYGIHGQRYDTPIDHFNSFESASDFINEVVKKYHSRQIAKEVIHEIKTEE